MSDAMFNVYIQISSLSITLLSSNQYPAERKFTSTVTLLLVFSVNISQ